MGTEATEGTKTKRGKKPLDDVIIAKNQRATVKEIEKLRCRRHRKGNNTRAYRPSYDAADKVKKTDIIAVKNKKTKDVITTVKRHGPAAGHAIKRETLKRFTMDIDDDGIAVPRRVLATAI